MLTLITPYQKKRLKNEDFDELSQLRTTIEKMEEGRINFQNKRVSSKTKRVRKRALRWTFFHRPFCFPYLPSSAGCFDVRMLARRAAFFHGVIQTIGKTPLTT
jgi:hypothetical protein